MKESEIRQIFLKISNSYSGFAYDDFKVKEWEELLFDTPFDQAQTNLRRYVLNPENKFPPHPGALAETSVQRSEGPYIPNVAETKRMLEKRLREQDQILAIPMPDSFREELKQLVERNRSE